VTDLNGDAGSDIRRCNTARPCPICGGRSWCQTIGPDRAQCMRVALGSYKHITQADGSTAYLHRLGGAEPPADVAALRPPARRADAAARDAVYTALLAFFTLEARSPRRAALRARGLTDERIDRAGYRDFPGVTKRWAAARGLFRQFGPAALGVPGVVVRAGQHGPYLTVGGADGLLIPVRDAAGRVVALKVRRDDPYGGPPADPKYLYLTSKRADWAGPSAEDALHVPAGTDLAGPVLRVTEGALKADVAAALAGDVPTVGMPSCSAWRKAAALVADRPAVTEVRVALDADFRTNPQVAAGVRDLLAAVTRLGRAARLEVWDGAAAKGIDDALAAGVAVRALDPDESAAEAARACAALGVAGSRPRQPARGPATGRPDPGRAPAATPAGGYDSLLAVEPDSVDLGTANKAVDDPFALARGFLARDYTAPTGEYTLRYYREDWHQWRDAAWPVIPADEVRGAVAAYTETVFDAENLADLAEWLADGEKGDPPTARAVTTRVVADTLQALVSLTVIPAAVEPPAWLTGPGPDLRECLFARNGVVHLPALVGGRADYLTPPTPRLFNPTALPFPFDPAAPEPAEWLRFVRGLWPADPDSVATLQEWFGYCLTADTRQQKMLMVVGPARSGKGTLARVLTDLVGRANTAAPTLGSLAERFGLWPLVGKALAVIGDAHLSGRADAAVITERLKSISGEDLQTVDRKNRQPVSVRLGARFVILTNEVPKLRDASAVIASRLVALRTTYSHLGVEDLTLGDRLAAELPGILLWAAAGWARLVARGRFAQPAAGAEVLAQLRALAAEVAAFAADRCELGPKLAVPKLRLFDAWKEWCQDNGRKEAGTLNAFSRDLFAALPAVGEDRPREGGDRVRRYTGIALAGR
jgi:P4 family phage/plasmid primase-like protien